MQSQQTSLAPFPHSKCSCSSITYGNLTTMFAFERITFKS